MHRYEKLEKLYYKKLYIKYFIYTLIVTGILTIIGFVYFNLNYNKKDIKKDTKLEIKKNKSTEIKHIIKSKKNKEIIKKLTLYPIYPDIDLINKTTKEMNKTQNFISKDIKKAKPKKVDQIQNQPKIKIIIKTETIKDLINLYNINPRFDNGMKIANYYFKHKKYEESIKWCKKVNKIEPEKYESWYLFAKNLIQLNKNKEAKKALIYYLTTYGPNDKIEKLLRSIK